MTTKPTISLAELAERGAVDELAIKIELQRGGVSVSVQWPACAGHECAAWLREVLK